MCALNNDRHWYQEFLRFLHDIDENLRSRLDMHLVMDNDGPHKVTTVRRWLTRHPLYHLHFTRTCASWLNLAERWIDEVTEPCVRRRSPQPFDRWRTMLGYPDHRNKDPKPFVWNAEADLILKRIADSGHANQLNYFENAVKISKFE